ncbi:LPXTG cell wall anchor domain-containing protein, partial [Companilactobacillus zhachilii]
VDPEKPVDPDNPVVPSQPTSPDNNILINSGLPSTITSKKNPNKFPQTGEKSSNWEVELGTVLLMVAGLFSHIIWRHSH